MASSVYKINKGINKAIEFKGLKAQYIWYLGAGLVGLLLFFAILYFVGVHTYLCLTVSLVNGGLLLWYVYKLSYKYGQYGMMKKTARRMIPRIVRSRSRKVFLGLKRQ
jgi:hypothetical protein